MWRIKMVKAIKMFRPDQSRVKGAKQGDAGYDNIRENIDPHIRTRTISTKQFDGELTFTGLGMVYGEICVEGNVTGDTVATATEIQFLRFTTNGHSNNTTPDASESHINILYSGKYLVTVSFSFSGDASVDWFFHVHTNNGTVEFANLHANRKLGAGGDIGSASISGIAQFNIGDTVELWMEHLSGVNKDITVQDCTLSVVQIGA